MGIKKSFFFSFSDIDECALWTHNCEANFVCVNTAGSYRCQPKTGCEEGYIQDSAGNCIGKLICSVDAIHA